MNVGESQRFNYTGGIQTFTVPQSGIYQLDVYGAKGGNATQDYGSYTATGGNGGHSKGYIKLKKGTLLYVGVGGAGSQDNGGAGYNGGGTGAGNISGNTSGGGGGATHIALENGTLASIGYSKFVSLKKGLIVAGGGGGAAIVGWHGSKFNGGNGGGVSGGASSSATGASQTGGGKGAISTGTFGRGGSYNGTNTYTTPGAGGGLYGGGCDYYSASGGSGYIGGVPDIKNYHSITESGVNAGNGYAIITFIKKAGGLHIGDNEYEVRLGDNEVELRLGDDEIGA